MNGHTPDYWREPMAEDMARHILSDKHFEWAVAQGAGYCAGRAHGSWMSNAQESFGAYSTAKRIATERAGVAA